MLYKICWKSGKITGEGKYVLTKKEAEVWIIYLEKKYPYIEHWIS